MSPSPEHERRLSPLAELTKARLREFLREKGMLFWTFGFPLVMTIGLGLAFRNKPPDRPRVAVVATAGARPELVRGLTHDEALQATLLRREEALRGLARSRFDILVELGPREPTYRFDPMQPSSRLARALTDDSLQRAAGRKDALTPTDAPQSAPGTRYVDFLIPGLLGMNVMSNSLWSIGYSLVLARKRKLLRRYAVTPMRRSHFLLSYFLARCVFLVAELGVLIGFSYLAFGVRIQGSYLAIALTAAIGAASFAGLGLIVGGRVENTETAQGWINFAQLPMWVLSGLFFSSETFPDALQPFIQALPLTAIIDALRLVFNEGATLAEIAGELGILAAWGVVGFAIAGRGFRWQ